MTALVSQHYDGLSVRVLLVEDSQIVTTSLGRLLRSQGFQLVIARCMAEALHLSKWTWFPAAVIDVGLPDGSGVELARQLLDDGSVHEVVFHTGEGESEAESVRATRLGQVVVKGSPPMVLFRALATATGRNSLPAFRNSQGPVRGRKQRPATTLRGANVALSKGSPPTRRISRRPRSPSLSAMHRRSHPLPPSSAPPGRFS